MLHYKKSPAMGIYFFIRSFAPHMLPLSDSRYTFQHTRIEVRSVAYTLLIMVFQEQEHWIME